jgi:hypothetical protein
MSNVVAATHVDEQCGCNPHYLSLGYVGRSEVMHDIASFAFVFLKYIYISMKQLRYLLLCYLN